MAPPPTTYDPVKTVDGMFNGSLTRMAYYFKDRKLYGEQTISVLKETSKKYQDALDDCEIQILYAKWYLEHQLALNRARRAPKEPAPAAAPTKRKLDSTKEAGPAAGVAEPTGENPAKRLKLQDNTESSAIFIQDSPEMGVKRTSDASGAAREEDGVKAQSKRPKLEEAQSDNDTTTEGVALSDKYTKPGAAGPPTKQEAEVPKVQEATTNASIVKEPSQDNSKSAELETLPGESQDFDLDSMFAETTANDDNNNNNNNHNHNNNNNNTGNKNTSNDDLNFEIDMSHDSFTADLNDPNSAGQANQSSLNSLLPGVETYANSTGEDIMMNFPSSSTAVEQSGLNATSNAFDLPEIGDSTTFDDIFNDQNLGDGLDGGGGAEDILNDDSMMNIGEFDDDSFFN